MPSDNHKKALDLYYKANGHYQKQEYQLAIKLFKKALTLAPEIPEISHNLAIAYADIGQVKKAIHFYNATLKKAPGLYLAHYNLGNLYLTLADNQSAKDEFQTAVNTNQKFFEGWLNLGIALSRLNLLDEANRAFIKALALKKHPDAYNNCAANLMKLHQDQDAQDLLLEGYQQFPDHPLVFLNLLRTAQNTCNFSLINLLYQHQQSNPALNTVSFHHQADDPFNSLIRTMDQKENLTVAKIAAANRVPEQDHFTHTKPKPKKRLHIGYLSFDYRDHVIGHHIMSLFKHHDRNQFDVTAYSLHPGDDSNFHRFIKTHADHYINLNSIPNQTAAKVINDDRIDILVDLSGHTSGNRLDILKYHPAPIAISYLGYPGPTGASYIDYIMTDPILTPQEYQPHYTEKFIYLPHGYQISSYDSLPTAPKTNKLDHGLPQKYFVFSCFNNAYKIDETIAQTWCHLLSKVNQSLIWLTDSQPSAQKNLKAYVKNQGVNPARLIFAKRTDLPTHLERLHHVDIALDTPRYNGGATTSNALYAGIPVITLTGHHYPSRMATSLVTYLGFPELATSSLKAYQQLAFDLATHPQKLTSLKQKLKKAVQDSPLFDPKQMTNDIESAYQAVWHNFLNGHPPRQLTITP